MGNLESVTQEYSCWTDIRLLQVLLLSNLFSHYQMKPEDNFCLGSNHDKNPDPNPPIRIRLMDIVLNSGKMCTQQLLLG